MHQHVHTAITAGPFDVGEIVGPAGTGDESDRADHTRFVISYAERKSLFEPLSTRVFAEGRDEWSELQHQRLRADAAFPDRCLALGPLVSFGRFKNEKIPPRLPWFSACFILLPV